MSETIKERAVSPKKIIKLIGMSLFGAVTAVLWAVMAVFLLGMLVRPAEVDSASGVRTDLAADFENILAKKMSGV